MKASAKLILLMLCASSLFSGRQMPTSTSAPVTVDYLLSKNLVTSYYSDDGKKFLKLSNCSLSDLKGIETINLDEYDGLDLSQNLLTNIDQLRFISSEKLIFILIQQNKSVLDISADMLFALDHNNPSLKKLNLTGTKLTKDAIKVLKDTKSLITYAITRS